MPKNNDENRIVSCSFCGKTQDAVHRLICLLYTSDAADD